ncbi:2-C-methyl-D-erythritol 4-phosphate cytidylyltransferase [Marinomonas posidonica]|uniref:2-C-methyl-D-erythritol 4-phosphate cytidylyltransferase n=1 Tax=Marinomonas posidonica (strain CECT 7376 / NCIMB 14433 / IVIA-Po-181) TaxID=491952 RepID=F6CY03_MARPP|nr:2-C-methyl-D-erythritol 4-phosphate cytidylyltransferase [Marinomonas posidonica]AEF55635.1 2-C-methyl-D-erythritol 4-phosphate cytidylyltransferase [Marinomonas posidonica IVIA-Po-181]
MSQALWVIIPAAGVGQRMLSDCPKQYLSLAGETILDRTIEVFLTHPCIAGVVVGLGANDAYWPGSKWYNNPGVKTYLGGAERSDTVQKGLQLLRLMSVGVECHVLVHDAARPLLSHTALSRIIKHDSAQGALLAMPSKDTVKQQVDVRSVEPTPNVKSTLDRRHIWLAQTPQKFPLGALLNALGQAHMDGKQVTDECSAMELQGWQPDLVMGENSNIKVTLPEDLVIAEALFSHFLNSKAH